MYTLKAKVNFYDKENPGRLVHPGELLTTENEARAKDLEARNFAEIVEQPEAAPKQSQEAPAAEKSEAEAGAGAPVEGAEAEQAADTVEIGQDGYPISDVRKALNAIGVKTAANAGLAAVTKKVSELSEEQAEELKKQLNQ